MKNNRLYDANVLEVIGIEEIEESDASARGSVQTRAQGTSDSIIKIPDLMKLVKEDAEKYLPEVKVSSEVSEFAGEPSTLTEARDMLKKIEKEKEKYRKEAEYYKGQTEKTVELLDSKSAERKANRLLKAYSHDIDREKVADGFKAAGRLPPKAGLMLMDVKTRGFGKYIYFQLLFHVKPEDAGKVYVTCIRKAKRSL